MTLFKRRDIEQYTDSVARYLPNDITFASKYIASSVLRRLLKGLAYEFSRLDGYFRDFNEQILPDTTTKYLDQWERALGIPDDCFTGVGTDDQRRTAIMLKLYFSGAQTVDDFVAIGDEIGIPIEIIHPIDEIKFPVTFPIKMFSTLKDARFTLIVRYSVGSPSVFPVTFPFAFGSAEAGVLECFLNKIKPVDTVIIFEQVI